MRHSKGKGPEILRGQRNSKRAAMPAEPSANGVLTKTDQGIFISDPTDLVVGGVLRDWGEWGADTLQGLRGLIGPESRLLILGAHIGALLVPLAKCCREVVAYEANPKTFRLLIKNIELNRLENCQAFNLAAGEKGGEIRTD